MNKKAWLLVVPIVLVPYLALFGIATVFFASEVPFFNRIMESIFDGNALYVLGAILLYYLLILALSVACFFIGIFKNGDALSLAKVAMIIKIAQAPAYLGIFVLGVLFVITIFTIPFSIGLFMLDCLSVFITALFVVAAVIIAIRKRIFTFKETFWVILLQFVFCADVVASIIFYGKLKRWNTENTLKRIPRHLNSQERCGYIEN